MLPQNPIETIDYYQLNSFSWLKPKFILSVTFELLVFRKIKEQRYIPVGRTDGSIGRKNRWVNRGNRGKNRWVNRWEEPMGQQREQREEPMGQQIEQREESMPLLYSPAISTEGRR
jgi:hypothetical protein